MIIDAYAYKQWADQRTLDAVRTIDPDRFPSETAFVRQQLNHMVIVEEVFRARLLGLRTCSRSSEQKGEEGEVNEL